MREPAVVLEPATASEREPPSGPSARLAIASWVLFDFATTIFSYVVLSRYFNEWIVIERGQPDIVIGVMSVTVALALVVALPSLGVLADRLGRHKPLLVAFTLCSVTGTALLGVIDGVVAALVVAGVAIFCFNSAEGSTTRCSRASPRRGYAAWCRGSAWASATSGRWSR